VARDSLILREAPRSIHLASRKFSLISLQETRRSTLFCAGDVGYCNFCMSDLNTSGSNLVLEVVRGLYRFSHANVETATLQDATGCCLK
jgi:hypothetical protein